MSDQWPPLETLRVVTFDIFDTLLHRRVRAPVDVFELVRLKAFEQSFSLLHHREIDIFTAKRIEAENAARARRVTTFGGEGEITLAEIYEELGRSCHLPQAILNWLEQCELDFESKVLFPSGHGLERYKKALRSGCDVAFLSDMYLPSEWLTSELERLGFEGATRHPIFVSGERRASKHTGRLYEEAARQKGWVFDARWLHVGDNVHSDIKMAQARGLSTEWADWSRVDNRLRPNDSELAATAVWSFMDSLKEPQRSCHLPEDLLARIGYRVWGPMLFGFICWLISELRSRKIGQAVFISRDGWLLKSLFERCQNAAGLEEVTTRYFYMSRLLGYANGTREWTPDLAWKYVSGKTGGSAEKAFMAAGLSVDQYISVLRLHGISDPKEPLHADDKWRLRDALNSVFSDILRASREHREKFRDYFSKPFERGGDIAFIDIGWLGNMQRCFVHSFADVTIRERVHGFYVGLHASDSSSNRRLGLRLNGWLNSGPNYERHEQALKSGGVELMEFILTADHGSAVALEKIDGGIRPILEKQGNLELEHQQKAMRAQAGVMKFFDDHLYLLESLQAETLSCTAWADEFLRLVLEPTEEEVQCLATLTHSDSAGSNSDRVPLAAVMKQPNGSLSSIRARARAREDAFWKAAFDRLNS